MERWWFKFPTHPDTNVRDRVWSVRDPDTLESGCGTAKMHLRVEWQMTTPLALYRNNLYEGVRVMEDKEVGEKSGGSVDYYQVLIAKPTTAGRDPYTAECNDIIEALGMNYAEGNVFKALWRSCAERTLGKKKAGGDAVYDAEKMVFFSARILKQRKEQN